ncbi:hypothetical protein G7Y89_g9578 [Cudoniella acicularis]|uniref:N-acetyltransferase domain-containing protein n=1 Tax=Cudoniella acicularis TaxID=354080 RepID=A0A8H4W1R6_9HELO|nr:hypothetical protein G7Y89_g9578 [Cudoniella acicularis]
MTVTEFLLTHKLEAASLITLATLSYLLCNTIYRLFFSPLSKIPGPRITNITGLIEANALKNQHRTKWVSSLFVQNPGAVAVRTGPAAVSFNHPDAVKAIYGHGKGGEEFGKSSWYDSFSTTGESLFSSRSKKRHAAKRRMVSHGFSTQALTLFEPYVDLTLSKFLHKMDESAQSGEPFDIYFWFELFTMDLMGELALGDNFGVIEAGKPARYSTLVEQSQRYGNLSGVLPFGKWNVKVLSWVPLPYVKKLWKARVEYLDYARRALEKRFRDERKEVVEKKGKIRQDIMQRFIEARDPETGGKMSFAELRAETSSLMVAGASTGSVTMSWMTYYLCKNPAIKDKIIKQLQEMFPDNIDGSKSIPFAKLNKLSLLEAVQTECLRLHPPIGYAMPRDTPPQGATICGLYIPGNIAVGVPAAIIGRNATVYKNPDRFEPERWLDETADLATMKTCFLGFGFGSRQCIGRNVATQFVMKMMATLLLRYEIELEEKDLVLGTKEFTILKPDQRWNVVLREKTPFSASSPKYEMGSPPTFSLLPASPSQIPKLAHISSLAFKTDTHTLLKTLSTGSDHAEEMSSVLQIWMARPQGKCKIMCAALSIGMIVGWACWAFVGFDFEEPSASPELSSKEEGTGNKMQQKEELQASSKTKTKAGVASQPKPQKIQELENITNDSMSTWQAKLSPPGPKNMILVVIAVDPSFQGQGVGRSLIQWRTKFSDEKGIYTWVHASEAGWKIFEKEGFSEVGRLRVDLDEHASEGLEVKVGPSAQDYSKLGMTSLSDATQCKDNTAISLLHNPAMTRTKYRYVREAISLAMHVIKATPDPNANAKIIELKHVFTPCYARRPSFRNYH